MTATALLLIAGAASAQTYSAILTGTQETPPNASPATGTGSFTLNTVTHMLSFNISYSGLTGTETAAHIHCCAAPGAPAGILFPLLAGNPKVGSVGPLSAQNEADLNAGLMYVNIHTSPTFGGGEIRGQIYNTVATDAKTWSAVKQLFKQ